MIVTIQPTEFVAEGRRTFGFRITDGTHATFAEGFESMDAVHEALRPDRLVLTILALCPEFGILETRDYLTGLRVGRTLLDAEQLDWPS